jgi:hypothetical protein
LGKEPGRERKEERGNRTDDKAAAGSAEIVVKHSCFLLVFCRTSRLFLSEAELPRIAL